jgi:ketosteroid isomerase-like protein
MISLDKCGLPAGGRVLFTCFALSLVLSCGAPRAADTEAAREEISRLVQKYAAAVNADGVDTNLAAEVWSNSPEVSLIHPQGHEHGWEQIKRNFYENAMRGLFSERKLSTRDLKAQVYGDAAWAEFYWHFEAKLKSGGSTVEADGRETQIYRRIGGNRWALVHVHYSDIPVARN